MKTPTKLKPGEMPDTLKELITRRLSEVQARGGFGQVVLYMRNGYIYRVVTTSEDYIEEDKLP